MEDKDKRDYAQQIPNPKQQKNPETAEDDELIPDPDDFDEGDYEDINDNIPDLEPKKDDNENETRTPGL